MHEWYFFKIIFLNVVLCCVWSFLAFVFCVKLDERNFNYKRNRYKPRNWERNGKFYEKKLKIKLWKDSVPQYIGKDGFSKKNMQGKSKEYIDRFILETCRGEWNHECCCIYSIIAIIINPLIIGVPVAILNFLINLPCVAIQRYNRIRLIKVMEKLDRSY